MNLVLDVLPFAGITIANYGELIEFTCIL